MLLKKSSQSTASPSVVSFASDRKLIERNQHSSGVVSDVSANGVVNRCWHSLKRRASPKIEDCRLVVGPGVYRPGDIDCDWSKRGAPADTKSVGRLQIL